MNLCWLVEGNVGLGFVKFEKLEDFSSLGLDIKKFGESIISKTVT